MADAPAQDGSPVAPAAGPPGAASGVAGKGASPSAFDRLRRMMQAPAQPPRAAPPAAAGVAAQGAGAAAVAVERCDFCDVAIPPEHSHVVDLQQRSLLCACRPCYLVFAPEGAAGGRYRVVPPVCRAVPGLALSDSQWDELQIPIDITFFFVNSTLGQTVAFYPSPGGATESLLPLDSWQRLVAANPRELGGLSPDVEALLVYRHAGTPCASFECYIVSIDACYELVGRIRLFWKGFHGGAEAWQEIGGFFDGLRARSGQKVVAR